MGGAWQPHPLNPTASKALPTDRHVPREFKGLWQWLCVLTNPAALEQEGGDKSDPLHVLPKLVLARPLKGLSPRRTEPLDMTSSFAKLS